MNEEFQFIADQAKKRLVEIVQEESAETLKEYLMFKGQNPPPPDGVSADAEVHLSAELDSQTGPTTTSIMATSTSFHETGSSALDVPQWLDPSILNGVDIFSQPVDQLLPDILPFHFPWPDQGKQDQADSAYGSNDIMDGSTGSTIGS